MTLSVSIFSEDPYLMPGTSCSQNILCFCGMFHIHTYSKQETINIHAAHAAVCGSSGLYSRCVPPFGIRLIIIVFC